MTAPSLITTDLEPVPSRAAPTTFSSRTDTLLGKLPAWTDEANALATQVNIEATAAQGAEDARDIALAAANYKGQWSAQTGAAAVPYAVSHNNNFWMLLSDIADVTASEPSSSNTDWLFIVTRIGVDEQSIYMATLDERTSNIVLAAADKGKLISGTGTWTQTLTAAATLGNGWWCYIKNAGTGDITIDPNETIDGLTSFVIYPGESRLVQCNGTAFYTVIKSTFFKAFTTSGAFTKPPGYAKFGIDGIGGGGGGNGGTAGSGGTGGGDGGNGGGGGARTKTVLPENDIGASEDVTIGAGGAAGAAGGGEGGTGGTTGLGTSNDLFAVYGGRESGGGQAGAGGLYAGGMPSNTYFGANGSAGNAHRNILGGGGRVNSAAGGPSLWGGGAGGDGISNATGAAGGTSFYGAGGGGGGGDTNGTTPYNGGAGGGVAAYTVGGGGAGGSAQSGGTTGGAGSAGASGDYIYCGAGGGGGGASATGVGGAGGVGGAPGGAGGGGAGRYGASGAGAGGAGARGELRIWGIL